ncbi:hypothetical protein M407DRAFT_27874 [Tulasnella calospora MUT 4182]|uniref:Uncharacterized protein n=1 Tax=Tulasnella calospora MUT 4182 TaxID=1051891 RepID=A0A0C3QBP5_9AGAM|nr:hypothetical protein M407DRAFT_27874 [Tulasnella calospora MUT 4182]
MNVDREDIAAAFEPSLVALGDAIRKHIAGRRDTHVFLVGGFAASPWILSETKRRLKTVGITCEVRRADSNTAKAVAHGGVAFYLDRNVTERTMRHTYGVSLRPWFDSSNPEHQARSHMSKTNPVTGLKNVDGGFFPIVKKGQVVKVDSVYRQGSQSVASRAPEMFTNVQPIKRYNGTRENIAFIDMDPSAFADIGWFSYEIPASAMKRQTGQSGTYYTADFEIVITLGTVEIKAHVEWEENGEKKKTPANSMWEDYY